MRCLRPACLAGAAAAAALLGAVGSGAARAEGDGASRPEVAPRTFAAPLAAGKRRVLRGTRRMARFVVPRGDTVLVTGTLRLTAARDIHIAGRLVVSPGAGVTLRAGGNLTLGRGSSIAPAPARRTAAAGPRAVARAQTAPAMALGGDHVTVDGDVQAAPGQSVQILVNQRGTVRINGVIRTRRGLDAQARGVPGGDSGSIIVNGGVFGNAREIQVGRRARLETGDGGSGFDDSTGELGGVPNPCSDAHADPPGGAARRQLFLEGTEGGNAGSIRLLARNYDVRGRIELGEGGRGGHAGFGSDDGPHARAPDGAPGHGGADVYAQAGSGGNGGSFETTDGDGAARAGAGGDAGSVRVAAGDGAANCDGGRTEARLAVPGKRGRRGARPTGTGELGTIALLDGGDGGAASDRDHAGGNGGLVRLDRAGSPRDPVAVTSYANGGAGFNGCTVSPPVNGTEGGAGGVVRAGRISYVAGSAFRGGRGGDGLPAGGGGRAGTYDRAPESGLDSFVGGEAGAVCPNAAFRFDASNLRLGWVSPHTGQNVTGTYALSFCGTNPFTQNWTYAGTVTDGPFGFSGFVRFADDPFMPVKGYNDLSGNPVATVGVRFALAGQPPTLVLDPTPVVTGATSIVDPGPRQVELVGRVVAGC